MCACKRILIIALTLLLSMSLSLWAEEEESPAVEKIDLPEAVTKAFAKDYPEMVMTAVEIEEIEGVTYYEIECGEGETDIIYLEDGTLYAVEQVIDVESLDKIIADAIAASYPDGEITEAEKITRGSVTEYEVIVVIEEEEEDIAYEVLVAADGEIVSEEQSVDEDEDEDVPDDVDVDDDEDED